MIENYCVLDVEANGALRNKAHPFDPRNRLVAVGTRRQGDFNLFYIDPDFLSERDINGYLGELFFDEDILLVGFNIKYDLHWLRRYNGDTRRLKIWDCQLAEFILGNQTIAYPSLEDSCQRREVALKSNILDQYINIGVDVDAIPEQELLTYLKGDLISTEELFLKQYDLIQQAGKWELFRLQCQDLLVLADMEYNGMKYDLEKSESLAKACSDREREITEELNGIMGRDDINWNSGDHLSAVLYGGAIPFKRKHFVGVYKTGQKVGQARYRWETTITTFPRLVEPLRGSELAKEGFYSTAEGTLLDLKATGKAKQIVKQVLNLAELSKIRGTYYEGIPKRFEEFGWTDGLVHGQLNQCVAVTGRTASSKPNLQNNSYDSKECFVSRYAD